MPIKDQVKLLDKKIDLKEAETEHEKVKGKVEQAIIHAHSKGWAIIAGSILGIVGALILLFRITLFFIYGN